MMDSLRTAANSLVLKIIFGIIIVSFILTGVSGYLIGGGNNYAAKVNDQEISRGQFENAFNSERNRMQQQLGDQYSELAANEGYMKTLRQQVLNRLIDEALLDQYARKPIFPGVLILEAMAQATGILAFKSVGKLEPGELYYFAGIDEARFKRPVVPGDQMIMEVTFEKTRRGLTRFKGVALVDGKVVCEATMMCARSREA